MAKLSDLRGCLEGQIKLVVVEIKDNIRQVIYEGRDTYKYNDLEIENIVPIIDTQLQCCGGYELAVRSLLEIRLIKED